jgi:hypothetical protein
MLSKGREWWAKKHKMEKGHWETKCVGHQGEIGREIGDIPGCLSGLGSGVCVA